MMHWKIGINSLLLLSWSIISAHNLTSHNSMLSMAGRQLENIYEKAEQLISILTVELKLLEVISGTVDAQNTTQQGKTTSEDSNNTYSPSVYLGYPPSCLAAKINNNGIYVIKVPGLDAFPVACDTRTAGAGWTVIQRRQDGSENFYRSWSEYRAGFGNLSGEFFIGLERLHFITAAEPYELFIQLEDFDGETHYAKYDRFVVANETDSYALRVLGKYSGDAGDSLSYHVGMPFSTYDNDKTRNTCALTYVGAWWYNSCQHSNLNGQYVMGGKYEVKLSGRGICWKSWRGYDYGYKLTQMMIRPRCRAASSVA